MSSRWARLSVVLGALVLAACSGSDTPQSLIKAGKEEANRKDHASAVIRFKNALQLDPSSGEARVWLGKSLLATGDADGAIVALNQALEQKQPPDEVVPVLARALLLTSAHKKLVFDFGSLELSDRSAQADLKTSIATAWAALGDDAKARAALDAALQAQPSNKGALLMQAAFLAESGDGKGANAIVDKVLAADAASAEAWLMRGQLAAALGKDAKAAEEAYRQSLKVKPDFAPGHTALIVSRLIANDLDGARALEKQMQTVLPKSPHTLFAGAQIAFVARAYARARELGQQLTRIFPNHLGVLHLMGSVEAKSGSLLAAERHFVKVLNNNPSFNESRRGLADVYIRLGQPARALSTLKPILEGGSVDGAALALAGDAHQRLGDAAAAEQQYRRAATANPEDSRIKTALALTMLGRGLADQALTQLESLARASSDTYADSALVSSRLKRRETDAAMEALQTMARKDPSNPAVLEWRGRILLDKRDGAGARAAFEEALKLDPRFFSATAGLAALDLSEGKLVDARKRFEDAIKTDPRNHLASMALAELLMRGEPQFDAARAVLVEATKSAPTEAGPRVQLVQLLLKRRLNKDAVLAAQEAAAALPGDTNVLDALGRAQASAGDVEQAIATFRSMAGANPDSPLAYTRLADLYRANDNRSAEEASLRKALEIDPSLAPAQDALVDLLLRDKRAAQAIEFARGLQRKEPADSVGYVIEAKVHFRNRAPDEALAVYRRALAVPGSSRELGRIYYIALQATGRNAEADKFGAEWMRKHPGDEAFDYQLAVTAITQGRFAEAETRLLRVVAKRPNHPLALNNLAWTLSHQNKTGGVPLARRAVELMPDRPALLDTLAMALAVEKQFGQALTMQQRALEMEPDNHGLRLNLAKIAVQAGDKALARAELEKLKAIGPSLPYLPEVNSLLAKL
jgi:putative PEP-CTERM system TPR-repeat lipoprotein